MNKELYGWHSPALGKEMPISAYGHEGIALLMIPTAAADFLEYERFGLLETMEPFLSAGKIRIFSINSINSESWLNHQMLGEHKAIRHNQFNEYVLNEVLPFIRLQIPAETPLITAGASFGALHSMNLFLKRPDLIEGVIAMSGVYDLTEYSKGFFDEQVYFNSPLHYLPNLEDENSLKEIRKSNCIQILSGSGNYEDPEAARRFSSILYSKKIPHHLSIWGQEWKHDWPTWRAMLPEVIRQLTESRQ